jgi:hypothetical protein
MVLLSRSSDLDHPRLPGPGWDLRAANGVEISLISTLSVVAG